MEIYSHKKSGSGMFVGGMLILIGSILMLQRFAIVHIDSIWNFWPFIFVVMGASKIITALNAREFGAGIWFIFLGLWLYVSINQVFGLGFNETWPAIIIAWGCSLIWKSFFSNSYRWIRG